jgi:hypothetical protein
MKALQRVSSYALGFFLCAHLATLNATLMAQQASPEGNGTAALTWTQNDIHDAMARGPVSRLTTVAPGRGGFRMNLVCKDMSKSVSGPMGQAYPLMIELAIEPINPNLKYKVFYVPPTTDVTLHQYFPNGPITGTGNTYGGGYEAAPKMRIDDKDFKQGGGDAQHLLFDFMAPMDVQRLGTSGLDGMFGTHMSSSSSSPADDALGKLVNQFANRMLSAGIYMTPDLSKGSTILLEQDFTDGSTSYIGVDLHDPTLHKFVLGCGGVANGGGIGNSNFKEPTLPLQHAETFQGDLAQFDAVLPEIMERALLKWKMPAHSLDAETARLEKSAAQCSSLTPEVVAALSPKDRNQLEKGHNYPRWQACEGEMVPLSRQIRQYDADTERGVLYQITPMGGGWDNAQAVDMKIMFTGLPGDGVLGNFFNYYGVIDAKIRVAPNGHPDASRGTAASPDAVAVHASGSASTSSRPIATPGTERPTPTSPVATTADDLPPGAPLATLTKASPIVDGRGRITAPGQGAHNYNVFYVDARAFAQGGELDVMIEVDKNSAVSGSFDLFPKGTQFTQAGASAHPLAGKYDVTPGSTVHLLYRFDEGQIFAFGAEGNWFSPKGTTGNMIFRASVH